MKLPTTACIAVLTTVGAMALAVSAQADSIPITYSLTGTGVVTAMTATTLSLSATANGSVLSANPSLNVAWNPVSYSDNSVLDLTTNLLNGTFNLVAADGDTLFGNVSEDQTAPDTSPDGTGPFPQTLTFTGGTGEFAGATGSVSGTGFLGATSFTVSGSGTLNAPAIPEPAPAALLLGGFALVVAGWRRRSVRPASEHSRGPAAGAGEPVPGPASCGQKWGG